MSVLTVVKWTCSIILSPFLIFFIGIVFFALIGKSLGVRRLYVKYLVHIFEYGKESLEGRVRSRKYSSDEENSETESDRNGPSLRAGRSRPDISLTPEADKRPLSNGGTHVISRDDLILVPDPGQNINNNHLDIPDSKLPRSRSLETLKREFELADCFDFVKVGVEAIIEDQVTSRFEAEELKSWNLLTRTNRVYEFISWKITFIWMIGFFVRYFFLFPLRFLICFFGVIWLTICTAVVGYVPEGPFKRWLNRHVSIMCFQVLSSALSSVIRYHNRENLPRHGICVANHTSPIDVLVLACDNCYALIGQRHGGFLGILQRALARASPHIWFERSEVKDREAVTKRLRQHVSTPNNPPILIFPEEFHL
ncbi:hypothetical protein M8J75_005558 [Diaphorina citri]|nr:hypothetical protein M8J75_005558 [Diaphorina citri]